MAAETNQLTLVKKGHMYVFRYVAGQEAGMIQVLVEKAADPKSPIDWFDAAVLSHQMGQRIAGSVKNLMRQETSAGS